MTKFTVGDPDSYTIGAATDFNGNEYAYVEHKPCGQWIYGGWDEPHKFGLYELFKAIDDHYCQALQGTQNDVLGGSNG
ncbi:MAG: hypothetical protein HOY79_17840 [Streptomyces sp.]|nr:hypothetical protein [Streptomyces sp.]